MDFSFKVAGLKETAEAIKTLPEKLRTKVIRKALYRASSVTINAIRDEITKLGLVETGTMKKRIGARVYQKKRTNQLILKIGPLMIKGGSKEERAAKRKKLGIERDPYYIRFLEFGTEYIRERHFVQRAFKASSAALLDRLVVEMRKEFEKQKNNLANPNKVKK